MPRQMKNLSPSDFSEFCIRVHYASASLMDFEDYYECYFEVLQLLWWNADIDLPLAINTQSGH
jgi:hypothetical protein